MENLVLVFVIAISLVAILFFRIFGKSELAVQWERSLPFIFDAIENFVDQADRLHDEILEEYGEASKETGHDPRLLYVIDRVEEFVEKTFRVRVDINWLIQQIELRVAARKDD